MKKMLSVILLLCLLTGLVACGNGGGAEPAVPECPLTEDSGTVYFYGIVKQEDTYYVRVLQEYQETPAEEDLLYVPLAEELNASFQPVGWVGAWCPDDYATARELASADKAGKISAGARFTYGLTDGRMDYLAEYNYYNDTNVTTGEGEIPEGAIITFGPEEDSGMFYFFGIVEEGGTYYVRVLREYQQIPNEEDLQYAPLGQELEAYFQEDGWEGGWSPRQYLSAQALAEADRDGLITGGVQFYCFIADGQIGYMEQYYEEPVVVLPEGKPEDYDLPVEEVPELLPDVLGLREKVYEDLPVLTTQNEVTEYFLWNFLWNRTGFECYLSRELAANENEGYSILNAASEDMAAYYLFSAYTPFDMYAEERGDAQGLYAKVKLNFDGADFDMEARAEALEYVMKHPVPEGGFTDYASEREYALQIHNYLACKVTYSPKGYKPEGLQGMSRYEALQEAYTILGEDQTSTVCAGYARGFALIAHYAGINVGWVWGNETETDSHAWNVLYPCDGSEPVLIDVTWDDTSSADEVGQTEVAETWFYVPLSEVNDHFADKDIEDFLNYLNQIVICN